MATDQDSIFTWWEYFSYLVRCECYSSLSWNIADTQIASAQRMWQVHTTSALEFRSDCPTLLWGM
jgi:hypothetical protein